MKYCPRCHKLMMESLLRKAGGNPNVHFHESSFTYPCQVPNYTYNNAGKPIAIIWDCKQDKMVYMHHDLYMKFKQEYEEELS